MDHLCLGEEEYLPACDMDDSVAEVRFFAVEPVELVEHADLIDEALTYHDRRPRHVVDLDRSGHPRFGERSPLRKTGMWKEIVEE